MNFTIEFLRNDFEDEHLNNEIALFNEQHQKIASKYGYLIVEQRREQIEDIIRWAFIHGSYERALELKRLLEISPYIREVPEGELLRPHDEFGPTEGRRQSPPAGRLDQ